MRKIEQQMNAAISDNKNWQSGNTSVTFDPETNVSQVFLHGNHIADVGDNFLRLFDGGWQSNTTKSRLNAILREHGMDGECVFQQQFEWFVRINTVQGMTTVPFFSSMRLGWMVYNMPYMPTGIEHYPFRKKGFFIVYKLIKLVYNAVK